MSHSMHGGRFFEISNTFPIFLRKRIVPSLRPSNCELRRIRLPRTPVNRVRRRAEASSSLGPVDHWLAGLGQEFADVDASPRALLWLNEVTLGIEDESVAPYRYNGARHGIDGEVPAR